MSEDKALMLVNSGVLIESAKTIEQTIGGAKTAKLRNGVEVTPAQLYSAAKILMDAEPSVITSVRGNAPIDGRTIGKPQERPGFIDADDQPGRGSIHFTVGIIPSTKYRITRGGKVIECVASEDKEATDDAT